MKYFKKHYESCSREWTEYGCYGITSITDEGDICTSVYSVECNDGKYSYDCYGCYFELDEITEISRDEYIHIVTQLQKVDEIQEQINKVLKPLIYES